jgi:hypothetical protein
MGSFRRVIVSLLAIISIGLASYPEREQYAVPPKPGSRLFTAVPPKQTGSVKVPRGSQLYSASKFPPPHKRQSNQQIPFVFCPEAFHAPPKHCDACGGDSYVHGTCNNILLSGRQQSICFESGMFCAGYYCECTHEGRPHNPQITSTTVVDGQTGTVIYEPLTLTEYAKLRSVTTVTLTDAVTATTSGESSLETYRAIIFAGGLTWLAVCK